MRSAAHYFVTGHFCSKLREIRTETRNPWPKTLALWMSRGRGVLSLLLGNFCGQITQIRTPLAGARVAIEIGIFTGITGKFPVKLFYQFTSKI